MSAHISHCHMSLTCDQCHECLVQDEYLWRCETCGNAYVVEISDPIEIR